MKKTRRTIQRVPEQIKKDVYEAIFDNCQESLPKLRKIVSKIFKLKDKTLSVYACFCRNMKIGKESKASGIPILMRDIAKTKLANNIDVDANANVSVSNPIKNRFVLISANNDVKYGSLDYLKGFKDALSANKVQSKLYELNELVES